MTRRAAAILLVAVALLFALAPGASADPIGDVTGGLGDALGGGGGDSQPSGSDGDPATDSGDGTLGDPIGGLTDILDGNEEEPSGSDDPVQTIKNGVDKALDDATGEVDEVANDPAGYLGGVSDTVDKTVKDTKRSLKNKGGRDRPSGEHSSSAGTLPEWVPAAGVYGSHLAAARATDPKGAARLEDATAGSTTESSTPGVFAEIGRVAVEAAEQVAFPLALALMVGVFLMVQDRIDRRDPKLALAPIDSDHELLTFS